MNYNSIIDTQLLQIKEKLLQSTTIAEQLYTEIGNYDSQNINIKLNDFLNTLAAQFSTTIDQELCNLKNTRDTLQVQLNELISESSNTCKRLGYTYEQYIQIFCTSIPSTINMNSLNGQIDLHKYYADSISSMEMNRIQLLSKYIDDIKNLYISLDDDIDEDVINLNEDISSKKEQELKEELEVLTDLKNKRLQTISLLCEQIKKLLEKVQPQYIDIDTMVMSTPPDQMSQSIHVIDLLKSRHEELSIQYKEAQSIHQEYMNKIKNYISILAMQLPSTINSLIPANENDDIQMDQSNNLFDIYDNNWKKSITQELSSYEHIYSQQILDKLKSKEKELSSVLFENMSSTLEKQRQFILLFTKQLSKFISINPTDILETKKTDIELFEYYNDYIQSLYKDQLLLKPIEPIIMEYKRYVETDIKAIRSELTSLITGRRNSIAQKKIEQTQHKLQMYDNYEKTTYKNHITEIKNWEKDNGKVLLYNGEPLLPLLESFGVAKKPYKK